MYYFSNNKISNFYFYLILKGEDVIMEKFYLDKI